MGDIAETANDKTARKRLHITPFNATLLDRFVPTAIRPLASDISFHTVETFPDKGFGYVELPTAEAEKLKKKLNGMTLKGTKVRIEDAKPEKKRKSEGEAVEDERKARKRARKEKRKAEEGVLSGHELESGRHVKRGWTEDGVDKKSKKKSGKEERSKSDKKDAKDKKMLFKTSIPPNALPVKDKSKKEGKEKQEKGDKKSKTKAIVQEGKKSSKLMGPAGKGKDGKLRYVDDQGWVDESGKVVEEAVKSSRPKREKKKAKATPIPVQEVVTANGDEEGDSVESGDLDAPSSEEPRSSEDEDDDAEQTVPKAGTEDAEASSDVEDEPTTPRITSPAQPDQVVNSTTEVAKEVHPLEALFKRPAARPESASKPKPSPIDTSFSFFNSGAAEEMDEDDAEGIIHPPQTPHTQRDMEWRTTRSAAPTPDTAAIGKTFNFSIPDDEDDEDEDDTEAAMGDVTIAEDDGGAAPARLGAQEGENQESAFRKWFYENRGDLNRGWKKRRRDERKQKRQRENRRLSRRVA